MQARAGLHDWIGALSGAAGAAVRAATRLRTYVDGAVVYRVGESASACFRVRTGRVRVRNESLSGRVLLLAEFRPGDCFGETGLIDGLPRFNTAQAVGDTRLEVLGRSDFDRLYAAHGEIPRVLNRLICHRMRSAYIAAEEASLLTLRERLARLLVRLAWAEAASNWVGDADRAIRLDGLSHAWLAQALGASRQAVSRELGEMARIGLLTPGYRCLDVSDPAALAALAGPLVEGEEVVPAYAGPCGGDC